jgi:hypothetical protein
MYSRRNLCADAPPAVAVGSYGVAIHSGYCHEQCGGRRAGRHVHADPLTFGAQAIGTTSAPQSVTVANTGNASLFIHSAAVPNTLDFGPVGTIMLRGGSGTMPTYNMGRVGVSHDNVRVYSALPDVSTSQQILIGGSFVN